MTEEQKQGEQVHHMDDEQRRLASEGLKLMGD